MVTACGKRSIQSQDKGCETLDNVFFLLMGVFLSLYICLFKVSKQNNLFSKMTDVCLSFLQNFP